MKHLLKLEGLGLLLLCSFLYFKGFHGSWSLYLWLFFVPDISFIAYLISTKVGAFFYNLLHHQGLLAVVAALGIYLNDAFITQIGLIFLAHSAFDRMMGYGLKYNDGFTHTHLGWIGKDKGKEDKLA